MRNKFLLFSLSILMLSFTVDGRAQQVARKRAPQQFPQGKLFIIGGGKISTELRTQILMEANWKKGDYIAAVSLASAWDSAYISMNDSFKKLTGENCVKIDSAAVFNPVSLDSLRKAKIIFFGGGDQSRIMQRIQGTSIQEIVNKAYQNGALIAGTSAGASVMSKKMITGLSLKDKDSPTTFNIIEKDNLELVDGLGLLDSVILDQHFVKRSRQNRMITAAIEHPRYMCIGIDESTAIIVQNGKATVTGESQVLVFQQPQQLHSNKNSKLAGEMKLSVYVAGDVFRVKR